jgi:hypothetical protein
MKSLAQKATQCNFGGLYFVVVARLSLAHLAHAYILMHWKKRLGRSSDHLGEIDA